MLAPHHDDESLFAAFLVQEWNADVIVCFSPMSEERLHGQDPAKRLQEFWTACDYLGAGKQHSLDLSNETANGLAAVRLPKMLRQVEMGEHERVYAPAFEINGQEQHNIVAQAAIEVYGAERVRHYTTYTRSGGRTTTDQPVEFDARMVSRKLRAMSAYRSQIDLLSTRGWFVDHPPIREYLA